MVVCLTFFNVDNINKTSDFSFMFNNCKKLKYLDLSLFETPKPNNILESMFTSCPGP